MNCENVIVSVRAPGGAMMLDTDVKGPVLTLLTVPLAQFQTWPSTMVLYMVILEQLVCSEALT